VAVGGGRLPVDRYVGVDGDLPEVAVRVGEVAGVAAPEGRAGRLDDPGTGALGARQQRVDLVPAAHVVGDAHLGRAGRAKRHIGVAGDAAPREQGQPHAAAQLEERDRTILEFLADDALAGQPKPLPVEGQRPLQVVDPERQDSDPRFPARAPPGGR